MNHTHRKPWIPLPPALPRFALPNESAHESGEADDPLDVATTQQRPAVNGFPGAGPRARRVVRKKPLADATEEVQVEDILLEAYAEEPPPPLTRRSASADDARVPPPLERESARESIAMAIASAVPPPAQSAAVDALLQSSEHAFAPYPQHVPQYAPHAPPLQGQGFVQPHAQPYAYAQAYPSRMVGPDFESVSVAPVMLASTVPPPARPVFANARANRANRAAVVAIWASVLVVLGVAFGGAVALGVKNGTYARLRDSAKSASVHAPPKAAAAPAPAAVEAPSAAPVGAAAPAPAPAPARAAAAPAPAPAPVESLAAPVIPADSSLVTFPAYAQGHRVFVDGRMVTIADGSPTKLKCGRHMVKIGSARKARVLDFACGREVVVK